MRPYRFLVNSATMCKVENGLQTIPAVEHGALVPYLPRITLEWLRADPSARRRTLDGTMAFVDVSGFTSMSERLASKGRLGAEEVTDVMSTTFARLLGVAYENGGGLLKLGGDAMLLFFDGPDHARRACSAAWGMRDSLRALGPLRTSVGDVELRMHVGIHSGSFDFFLVGRHHRELIVAGHDAARTVEMEDTAEVGEIVITDATGAFLEADNLGGRKGTGFLLDQPPAVALTGIPAVPDVAGLDLLACVPSTLRDYLTAEKIESEHRHGVVAFVRFGGVHDLLHAEGPDAATDAIEEVVDVLQEASAAHEVCFLESDIDGVGGRIILVAGVPTTSGDDEERMLRTVRAALEASPRLPLHIGVAAGNLFAGRVGPPYRRAYTILGGTAALAARLMAKADANAIWTTPEVLERSRAMFATQNVGALTLKGKAQPVETLAVGALAGVRVAESRKKLPLVDRQREMPVLAAALVPVRMGFGSFVELIGDAGIGKSRIIEELCDQAEDLSVVSVACEQYEATTPYFVFRKLLADLLAVPVGSDAQANSIALSARLEAIDSALVPWLPLLADVLDAVVLSTPACDDLQPSFRRARLKGVVETILGAMLEPPTLLVFEDAHWMDEASCDLLRHLGTHVSGKPWLVCSTRRPAGGGFTAAEGTPPVPALSLRLDPIPEADAHDLATSAAGANLDPQKLAAIIGRAGGNPLFVQELVAATQDGRSDVETLPGNVEGVVTSRIDGLAPADRALLRWASVMGTSFSGDLVAQVLEGDPDAALDSESWDRLGEFVERDPYVPGQFGFRHALIRDAAYAGLSFRRRRELHARVGEVLRATIGDEEDSAELLSLHFSLAERPSEAWFYSLLAAGRAKAKFANADAAEFYRRALDAADSLPSLSRVDAGYAWEALGDVLELGGDYREARLAYTRAREAFRGHADALAGLYLKEGRLRENTGNYAQALRSYARGLRAAEAVEGEARIRHGLRLSLGYAAARFRQGAVADCIEWCEKVVNDARSSGELAELAHAYYLLHLAYTSLGSRERTRVRELALPIYEELGDLLGQANALNNLGIDGYYEGRWDDALEYYERSRRARERIGDVVGAATIANNIAEIYSDQGRLEEAAALFDEVRETCEASGSLLMSAVAAGNLGRTAARGGDVNRARTLLTSALAALEAIGAATFVYETRVRLAEAAVLAHEPEAAHEALDGAEELGEGASTPSVQALLHRVRAYAHIQLQDVAEAERALARSLEIARGGDALYEVALTLQASANLRGDDELAREARTLLDSLHVIAVASPPLP
jgi:class 3 adenylate cyclase/tetratricopeptide (TPR) repeat protein